MVLPQGKFDQFLLQIKPAERAAMLERLFNLGQFGDELANKAGRERSACAEQIERIEGEEQGLGDCSEEAMTSALRDLQAKGTELERIKLEYENADKAHRETIALRDLYQKKKDAETKKAELDQDRDAVAEMEARLAAAERAEPLRSLIEQEKELAGRIADPLRRAAGQGQAACRSRRPAPTLPRDAGERRRKTIPSWFLS